MIFSLGVYDLQNEHYLESIIDYVEQEMLKILVGPHHLKLWTKSALIRKDAEKEYHRALDAGGEIIKTLRFYQQQEQVIVGPPLTNVIKELERLLIDFENHKSTFRGLMKQKSGDFSGYIRELTYPEDYEGKE